MKMAMKHRGTSPTKMKQRLFTCYKYVASGCVLRNFDLVNNTSFGSWTPVLRVISLVKLDLPETIRD